MTFLKLLLNGCLLFIATIAQDNKNFENATSTYNIIDGRLPSSIIVPIHYNISLILFTNAEDYISEGGTRKDVINSLKQYELIEKEEQNQYGQEVDNQIYFCGQSSVRIYIRNSTQRLILHSLNLYMDNNKTMLINQKNTVVYKPYSLSYNDSFVILDFTVKLSSGYYSLIMEFVGTIVNNTARSFFLTSNDNIPGNVTWIIATRFQPIGARQVFPCWDEPQFKASFNISIKYKSVYSALSNMPKIENSTEDHGRQTNWTYFKLTSYMPTYAVAFVLTNMPKEIYNAGRTVYTWWSRMFIQMNEPKIAAANLIAFWHKSWPFYIKYSKLDHIVIPDAQTNPVFLNDIMDNWGMIFYRESDIIVSDSDYGTTSMRVKRFVTYKMMRHLFSSLIRPTWWSHMWLNDALAQFYGVYVCEQDNPREHIMDFFIIHDQEESFRLDTEPITMSLAVEMRNPSKIEDLFSNTNYAFTLRYRTPIIIRMLQHIVTNEIFQLGIRRFLDKHLYSLTTPDDLLDAIQNSLDESQIIKNKISNLKEIMNFWIYKVNYPVVNVTLNFFGSIVVRIDYPNLISSEDMWPVPLTYTTQTNLNFTDTSPKIWLNSPQSQNLPLHNKTDWIIVNLQQAGYYRVNYYSENWWKIAKFLNSDQYKEIHILNRVQIISDAYYFLEQGNLDLPLFLELTKYLSRETDYLAWYPMFRILEYMSNVLPFINKWNALIKVHIRNILFGLLNEIGYDKRSDRKDFTTCLREEAIKWACLVGDSDCMRNAAYKLKWHLDDFEQETYLRVPNCEAWRHYKSVLKKDIDSDIMLEYIKFAINILPKRIALINQNVTPAWVEKREKEYDTVLGIIVKNSKNTKILEYILENFHQIPPKQLYTNGQIAVLITIINYVYCNEHLNMISNKLMQLFPSQEKLVLMIQHKITTRMSDYTKIRSKYLHLLYYN